MKSDSAPVDGDSVESTKIFPAEATFEGAGRSAIVFGRLGMEVIFFVGSDWTL